MANKTKRHGNRQSADDFFQYAQRAMEKQDFKEALKNAKLCFRQDPTHEHRQILERSWLGRGLQLARSGLQSEGRAAAQELLALGVSEPDVRQGLPELLLAVGLYDQAVATGKVPSPGQEADPAILARAADRAVVDPATAPASLAGIQAGAATVRAALDALYAGDETAALAAVGDVPRNSPFADWKLFVRGLAAYYRHDDESMRANWDRLDAERFAARLAAPLRRLADPVATEGDLTDFRQAIRVLEPGLLGGPVVWYLESLQKSLGEGHWREAVTGLRRWKKDFQGALPGLAQRLDRLFYDMAVRKANSQWLRDLRGAVEPPRWDPRWNRAGALIAVAEGDNPETVQERWLAYMEDLASVPDLKPGDLALARAMIWERLARLWVEVAEEEDDEEQCNCEQCRREREEEARARGEDDLPEAVKINAERAKAIECLNKAIGLAPGSATAYRQLAKNYIEWKRDDAAAEVYHRLLEHVADDLDAFVFLHKYHRQRDEALLAREYALRARRLKPASDEILGMVVSGHYSAARAWAMLGRYDEARAELAAVEAAGAAACGCAYDLTVRRAMVEYKAGQPEAGRRLVDQALEEGGKSSDVYMVLSIEAARYEVPFQLNDLPQQFWHRWQSTLKKRSSQAAGAMSRRMLAFMQDSNRLQGKYAFLNDYLKPIIKYVGGCTRIRWQAGDLTIACQLLAKALEDPNFREVRKQLVKLLDIGRKKFLEDPDFHYSRGELEYKRGPGSCNWRLARECFEMAIEAAKSSSHADAKKIQQLAQERLRVLGDADERMPQRRRSRGSPEFAGMPPDFMSGDIPGGGIIEMIRRMSASMGVEPQDVLDEILNEFPFAAGQGGRK